MNGRLQSLLGIIEFALAEIIQAQPVIGDGLQGNADLINVLEYLSGKIRGVFLIVAGAGQVGSHQGNLAVQRQCAFRVRVGIGNAAVQQVLNFQQKRVKAFNPVCEKQPPDPEHLQLWAVLNLVSRDSIQPFKYRKVIAAMNQVVAVFRQNRRQMVCIVAPDNLDNPFLDMAMAQ